MGAVTTYDMASSTAFCRSSSVPRAPIHGSPPLIPGASTLIGERHGDRGTWALASVRLSGSSSTLSDPRERPPSPFGNSSRRNHSRLTDSSEPLPLRDRRASGGLARRALGKRGRTGADPAASPSLPLSDRRASDGLAR
eukprot:scaffold3162_cov101-Isochrysis_galbana.AAC.8